jgi:hypothetical protein
MAKPSFCVEATVSLVKAGVVAPVLSLEQLVAIMRIPMNAARIAVIEGQPNNFFINHSCVYDFFNYIT